MELKVKCIKDIYAINDIRLFTSNKIYHVQISHGEWRTKDDTCKNAPYNHLIIKSEDEDNQWFEEYFEIYAEGEDS